MKQIIIVSICGFSILFSSFATWAVTQNYSGYVIFANPIDAIINLQPSFGIVEISAGPKTYTLSTTGAITGTGNHINGGNAGDVDITGGSLPIDIIATNLGTNNGVTPFAITCDYNNGGSSNCMTGLTNQAGPTVAGKKLIIGLTVTTSGGETDGETASPTFDIVVTYN